MKLILYQVDAFTTRLFGGNPAAIIPMKRWIDESLMQQIAMENNLAETAFLVPSRKKKVDYEIRWFTPALEIDLCGHATLASAHIVFEILREKKKKVVFDSKSGLLTVFNQSKKGRFKGLMDFPSWKPRPATDYPEGLTEILGIDRFIAAYRYRDLLIEMESEGDVAGAKPNYSALKKTGEKVIITAPGKSVDFVSRFFAPAAGIDEDPVTGSAHSQLIPFWSEKLGKTIMQARQLSTRCGDVYCEQKGERVLMGGSCVFYMKGELTIGNGQQAIGNGQWAIGNRQWAMGNRQYGNHES